MDKKNVPQNWEKPTVERIQLITVTKAGLGRGNDQRGGGRPTNPGASGS